MTDKRAMHKLNREQNNRGAALISVIIVMAVITILGFLALSVSYDTYRMKQVEKNASENFYGAEKALEEISAGLQGIVSECYEGAYTDVMIKYAAYDTALEMQMDYNKAVIGKLLEKLRVSEEDTEHYNVEVLKSYVTDAKAVFTIDEYIEHGNFLNVAEDGVYLRNVAITYKDKGYSDQIVTDIKLTVPPVVFEKIVNLPNLVDYSIIAEDGIQVTGAGGQKVVTGNVYAGTKDPTAVMKDPAAITMSAGTVLSFTGTADSEVICGGNIEVSGNASFVSDEKTVLWAKGIAVPIHALIETNNNISLLGTTYVKDDTTINGKQNSLTLGGRYFGYSGSSTDADDSSAIIINGVDTSLDMKELDTLVLSGTSFVGTKGEAYDKITEIDSATAFNQKDVFMGDSVAIKGNQLIYMVPVECDGIKSNPMTYDQFLDLLAERDWERKALSTYISGLGRSIGSYGNVRIRPVFTNKMNGAVYLYLEFSSVEAASEYFMDNFGVSNNGQKAREVMETYLSAFTFMEMGQIHTAGNYLVSSAGNPAVYVAATSGIEDMNLEEAYDNKCKEMQFDQLIDRNLVYQMTGGLGGVFKGHVNVIEDTILQNEKTIELVVIDNANGSPVTVNNDLIKGTGVLIATGDVILSSEYGELNPFTGMILCGGTLEIQGTYQYLNADSEVTAHALRIENEKGISGMDLFKGYGGNSEEIEDGAAEDKGKIDIRNCVTFENWKTR